MKELKYFYKTSDGKGWVADYVPRNEEGLIAITKAQWDAHVVSLHHEPSASDLAKANIRNQIAKLKSQLAKTDYQCLKYAEGWISEEDYAPIKASRQALRDQINELEGQL